ncbi:hypothetical protein Psed_0370 [Pseudonocardia dioxanivorans CB1190]|uniref:Uncharacterized protein n=2 Tax=Pseudonocardia TaxID=1847 RepID=F4CS82_PSEUX|nr:hypothetical protein Psed_0370 [Pseudonocardia dioxanivorans CB1190]
MWLVRGVDEEHRFREWHEAVEYHRLMVRDWAERHGDAAGAARTVDDLAVGASSTVEFPDPECGTVVFTLVWERAWVGLEGIGAC